MGLLGRSYLHEYAVEYRSSSPSSPVTDYVPHRHETGATTTLATTALPATYPFIRTLKTGNALSILASLPGSPAARQRRDEDPHPARRQRSQVRHLSRRERSGRKRARDGRIGTVPTQVEDVSIS